MTPLALIPAKGTSERFPGKNLAPLAGRPLLVWTIAAAKAADIFGDRIWVSSEDADTLALARQYGVNALPRPAELAAPTATVNDVVAHARMALEWRGPIYILLPTSPLRSPATIQAAWEEFERRQAGSLLSVVPLLNAWASFLLEDGVISPAFPAAWNTPRQLVPALFQHDGGHQIVTLGQGPMVGFGVRPEEAVDITTAHDLAFCEFLIASGRVPWIGTSLSAR